MRLLAIVVALFLSSCEVRMDTGGGWYCWSPGTPQHEARCTKECMDPGNPRIYCYCETNCGLPSEQVIDE